MFGLGEAATLGPWRLTLDHSVGGDEATALIASWNSANSKAPDGLSYVVATIKAENIGSVDRIIGLADFRSSGKDGVLRQTPTLSIGGQALQGIVAPGETLTGVIPLLVDDFETCVLWFESTLLGGNWANATFALGPSAEVPTFETSAASSGAVEGSIDAPASFGEYVRVGDWEITLSEVVEGQEVFDLATSELRALGQAVPEDIPNWLAVSGKVTNVGPIRAYFSPTSLLITDESGEPWDDILALTPPQPDFSCYLLPGASREGWAAFQRTDYGSGGELYSTAHLIQVLPSTLTDAPKFFSLPNVSDEDNAVSESANESVQPPDLSVGDQVVTIEDMVNLRAEPSIESEILAVLGKDVPLDIVADAIEADGYIWFQVENSDLEYAGFVADDFIASAH